MMKISYMIAAKNMVATIGGCLASIVRLDPDELVVVDGYSTDGTSSVVDRFNVVHVYDDGVGLAAARNLALEYLSGDYVVFPDADQYADPSFQTQLREILEVQRPDIVVHSNVLFGNSFWARCYQVDRAIATKLAGMLGSENTPQDVRIIRRQCVVDLGGWDSTMRAYEDADMWHRLHRAYGSRLKIVAASGLKLYTDERDITPYVEFKRGAYYGRGLVKFIAKNRRFLLISLFPPFDVVFSIFVAFLSGRKTFRPRESVGIFVIRCARSLGYLTGVLRELAGRPY